MNPPAPRVVGTTELGIRWGVSKQRADQITRRETFPAGTQLAQGRVWETDDIEAWEAAERSAGKVLPGERNRHLDA